MLPNDDHRHRRSVLLNAVSAAVGGGLNDLVHTLPSLRQVLGLELHARVSPRGFSVLREAGDNCVGVQSERIGSPFDRARWEFFGMPRTVRKLRPDVVLQFSNLCPRKLQVPQVVVLRSMTFFSRDYAEQKRRGAYQSIRYGLGRQLTAQTMQNAAAIICISETMRREVEVAFPHSAKKLSTAWLGVTAPPGIAAMSRAEALATLPEPIAARLQHAIGENSPVVVHVSTYYQQKNLLTLLRAALILHARFGDFRLIITAGIERYRGAIGPQEQQEIELARRLSDLGVLVDLGPVRRNAVWPLLRTASAFAFPSSLEAFGHPLLEAMAAGVPVIASDTPIHREIGAAAALYHETFSAEALADAIATVLQDSAVRQDLISRGLTNAARFSWSDHVARLMEVIEDVRDRT